MSVVVAFVGQAHRRHLVYKIVGDGPGAWRRAHTTPQTPSVWLTLTLKYNFLPDSVCRPYIGAGIDATSIMNVRLNVPTVGAVKLDSTNVGAAAQAGFDYKLGATGS